jgi:hypothetical protein
MPPPAKQQVSAAARRAAESPAAATSAAARIDYVGSRSWPSAFAAADWSAPSEQPTE